MLIDAELPPPEIEFVALEGARLLTVHHRPAPAVRATGAVLFVPALAEEMNKSRRLQSSCAGALAAAGLEVLALDLFGTGDSEGEFAAAGWERWCADLRAALMLLRRRAPGLPLHLIATRAGALLAADALRDQDLGIDRCLLWQPVTSGEQWLVQFLRMRTMASRFAGVEERVEDLRAALKAGASVEVAGYELPAAVAAGLERTALDALPPPGRRVCWFEIAPQPRAEPGVAQAKVLAAWRARGAAVEFVAVAGEQFWATVEIAAPAAVIERSLELLLQPADER